MSVKTLVKEARKLTTSERWELVDQLLRMGKQETADTALTPAQAADLERRMEEARSGNDELIPGDQVVKMLKKRA
jgi:putative addiction module component (TIGR02574 family)